jgi:L-ribulose-5-phosphate 3-epimerase
MKFFKLFFICSLFFLHLDAQNKNEVKPKPINLLDSKLSFWYKWIGVPHTSVTGLPSGTPTGDGMNGIPLGMNDPKNVFSVITLNGEKVLKASGEIYGGLTTKKEYENYHLHLQYKWGTKKWAPRLTLPRDMGIMFHLTGTNEDAFWSVFMMGLECQISDSTSADIFLVPNKTFSVFPFAEVKVNDSKTWDINAAWKDVGANTRIGTVSRSQNYESQPGAWTIMDVYTHGSSGVYMVNGHVVMAFNNAGVLQANKTTTPLTKGKIQLQSEGAEGYYKDITIQSISDIPANIKKAAGLDLPHTWKMGIATYTFHSFSFPEALEKIDSAGLQYIEGFPFQKAGAEFKDSSIMNLSADGHEKLYQLINKAGFKMESIYAFGGKDIGSWKKQFDIAKQLHVKFITAEPPVDLWNSVDSLAGIYGIKVALHNHWKGTSVYWHPDSVLAALKNHPNFGICADLGHWPKSGINPVDALKKLQGHIIAIHLKDIAEYNNTKIQDVTIGTGVVNFPEVFKELERQKFNGYIYIEKDVENKPDNLSSVNASVKYYNNQLGLSQNRKKAFSSVQINKSVAAETNLLNPVNAAESSAFKEYSGIYKMSENSMTPIIKIIHRNGDLYIKPGDYPELKLTFKKGDEFEEGTFNIQVAFKRKDGLVNGVNVTVQGTESTGVKETTK